MSRTKILPRVSVAPFSGVQSRSLQHQLDGLSHRHKKAGDLGMGDGQRAAGGELALNKGTTDPVEPSTLPKRTVDVPGPLSRV